MSGGLFFFFFFFLKKFFFLSYCFLFFRDVFVNSVASSSSLFSTGKMIHVLGRKL